jgi:thiamine-phosphate pyrophosphorylase
VTERPPVRAGLPYRLLAITDRRLMGPDPIARAIAVMEQLGDRVLVQVRERDLEARELHRWLEALLAARRWTGAGLMINGRGDVARAFAPEVGVHLPEAGLPIEEARRLLPRGTLIGASTHDLVGARASAERGADLITVAPVFPTPSKPETERGEAAVLGVTALGEVVRAVRAVAPRTAVFALGGIDRANAGAVFDSGVDGIAAIRAAWCDADFTTEAWNV